MLDRSTLTLVLLTLILGTALAGAPDQHRAEQWYLDDIRWDLACALECGDGSVRVVVIDTGFDLTHPDLASRFVAGWDYLDNDADPHDYGGVPSPLTQALGHGTHVAGVLGAITENGIGISGVADVQIVPFKGISNSVGLSAGLLATMIEDAAEANADIISLSGRVTSGDAAGWTALNASIAYAEAQGTLIVAAAGNAVPAVGQTPCDFDSVQWPAAHPLVLGVAGTTADGTTSPLSHWGAEADIAAPMEGIFTTQRGGGYTVTAGTSFSTPMVSGTAALMLTADPSLTPAQVREIIADTGLPIPRDPDHVCVGHSASPFMPFAKLDSFFAVDAVV